MIRGQRISFEAWYARYLEAMRGHDAFFARDPNGRYRNRFTEHAWRAWEAASRAAARKKEK